MNSPAPYSRLIAVLLGILTTFAIGFVLLELKVVLLPFAIAALIAMLLKPMVRSMRSKGVPMVFAMLIVLASITLIGFLFTIILSSTISQFITELPGYRGKFEMLMSDGQDMVERLALVFGIPPEEVELPQFNFSAISTAARAGLNTLFNFLSTAFLIVLFLLFMLMGSGQAEKKVRMAFPADMADRISLSMKNIGSQVRRYLLTKTLVSLGTGSLTFLVLYFLGVDFPLIWGFLTFLLNFIPNVGSIISVILPSTLALLQFDGLMIPILSFILLGAVQVLMGHIIEPRILGYNLNLSPLLILVSLIVWGWLWGVGGMILAVPITATIKIVLGHIETFRPVSVMMSGANGDSN